MLGVCITVLALLGTVLLGYNLGVDEVSETRTAFTNITNITSQFSYNEGSSYVDYNPASNYTGYTPGSIEFTTSGTANQYSVITTPGSHQTVQVDLSDTGYYSTNNHAVPSNSFTGRGTDNWWLVGGYAISVADLLTHNSLNYADYPEGITINLLYGTPYTFSNSMGGLVAYPNLVTAKTNNTFNSENTNDNSAFWQDTEGNRYYLSSLSKPWYWTSAIRPYFINNYHTTQNFEIQVTQTGNAKIIYGGNVTDVTDVSTAYISWADTAAWTSTSNSWGPSSNGGPFWPSIGNSANSQVNYMANNNIPATNIVTIEYDVGAVVDYMRVSDGVSFKDPIDYIGSDTMYSSQWNNGQSNASVSWAIHFDDLSDETRGFIYPNITTAGATDDDGYEMEIAFGVTDGVAWVSYLDSYNSVIVGDTAKDIGAWEYLLVTFDSVNRTLSCTPITSFSNYQNFTTSSDTITIQSGFPAYNSVMDDLVFDSVSFTIVDGASNNYRISVTDTVVEMGFNKNIFVNPSLDPRSLFLEADYPILRISFDSVALFGNSVTINGVTYPVENGRITIGTNVIPVSGLSVTYMDDGHVYAGKGNNDVDLGEETSSVISLDGQWYYQARAANGYLETVDVVDWDAGHWNVTMQQAILVFEACLVVGILIAYHKKSLATLDWVIVIIAGFSGAVMFV